MAAVRARTDVVCARSGHVAHISGALDGDVRVVVLLVAGILARPEDAVRVVAANEVDHCRFAFRGFKSPGIREIDRLRHSGIRGPWKRLSRNRPQTAASASVSPPNTALTCSAACVPTSRPSAVPDGPMSAGPQAWAGMAKAPTQAATTNAGFVNMMIRSPRIGSVVRT